MNDSVRSSFRFSLSFDDAFDLKLTFLRFLRSQVLNYPKGSPSTSGYAVSCAWKPKLTLPSFLPLFNSRIPSELPRSKPHGRSSLPLLSFPFSLHLPLTNASFSSFLRKLTEHPSDPQSPHQTLSRMASLTALPPSLPLFFSRSYLSSSSICSLSRISQWTMTNVTSRWTSSGGKS